MALVHLPTNLDLELESDARDPSDRWPMRLTATFVLVVCGSFWGGVAFVVHQIFAH